MKRKRRRLLWKALPNPKVGSRVHLNTGHDITSWTGIVAAIVDHEWFVIRVWGPRKGWRYFIEWRWSWDKGHLRPGPLPRRKPQESPPRKAGVDRWVPVSPDKAAELDAFVARCEAGR